MELCKDYNVTPIIFMPWAMPKSERYNWITQEEISNLYYKMAEKYNVKLAPIGDIFWELDGEGHNFQLIKNDNVHPTIVGTYLITSVLYTTIFEKNPVRTSYIPEEFNKIYGITNNIVTKDVKKIINSYVWEFYSANVKGSNQ